VHDFLKELTSMVLEHVLGNPDNVGEVVVLELLMKLFYNLNYQDLHPKYEDNLGHWMQVLKAVMKLQNKNEEIFKCKGAVLEVILLYANKYKDDVQETIQGFCQEIWELSSNATEDMEYDSIVFNSLKFFKSLLSWPEMRNFFGEHMNALMEKLIFPNIGLNNTIRGLFEEEPDNYIDFHFRGA
jgi:exportin-2 (importin alpha re-exporter)